MRTLHLVMHGSRACNGRCAYCCSRENLNKEKDDIKIDKEAIQKAILGKFTPERVMVWGTEPLLHFDELKRVVAIVREVREDIPIGISTNGILLCDKERTDWILDNLSAVQLSWDGLAQHLRTGYDFLDNENITRIARSGILYINCVLHGKNTDVKGNIEYFENWEKRIGKRVNIRLSTLMPGDNGEYSYKYPNMFLKECKKYISHRYFRRTLIMDAKRFRLNWGERGCFAFTHKWNRYDIIDTLGKPCPCNLLDSSQKPSNSEGKHLEECKSCIYKDSRFCNHCVSNPLEKKCVWNKAYNNFLIALHAKLIKYEQQSTKTVSRMASTT